MIAMATDGRGGLRRMVLGNIADKLVRTGELPVLVTRPRGK
jgi:nucleotide-binding universal stress UspA family protein